MSTTTKPLLNRRQFTAQCAALGVALPTMASLLPSPALAAAADKPSPGTAADKPSHADKQSQGAAAARTVQFPDGTTVPAVGQGSWHLGQDKHPAATESEALNTGLALGMTLIDTSGNYGNGRSEQLIGRALAGKRDQIYLVTKVEAEEVAGDGIARACDASLKRLATDHIDLYLLHFPVPSAQLAHVVEEFEKLKAAKKIGSWGVSNFDQRLMDDLFRVPNGTHCATNQVQYSLRNRRIERDVLPWCTQHNMPVMAYSPLGGGNNLVVKDKTLLQIGAAHGCSAAAVALAWVIRSGKVIAIPESGSAAHTKENAEALSLTLTPQDLKALAAAFPGPSGAS